MKMASSAEYDYNCPVCCDIFKTPVILSCSHSVCKECLQQFWRTKKTQECPVCRRRSSKQHPPVNLALQNLCESFLKERNESCSSESEEICSLHREKLKLFCLEDKQPVCLVCFTSKQHDNHKFRPITEVVSSYRVGISPCYIVQLYFFYFTVEKVFAKIFGNILPPPPNTGFFRFFCVCKLNSVIPNCSYWVRLHAVEKFDLSVLCIFTGNL